MELLRVPHSTERLQRYEHFRTSANNSIIFFQLFAFSEKTYGECRLCHVVTIVTTETIAKFSFPKKPIFSITVSLSRKPFILSKKRVILQTHDNQPLAASDIDDTEIEPFFKKLHVVFLTAAAVSDNAPGRAVSLRQPSSACHTARCWKRNRPDSSRQPRCRFAESA